MIDWHTLLLFSIAALALVITPGPDMLLIASRSVSQGRLAGWGTLLGIQLGTYCHALAAGLGLSQLLLHVPLVYHLVRFAGASYLLYLAWSNLRAAPSTKPGCDVPVVQKTGMEIVLQGLVTNLLNPKMALFVLALFPQFLQPSSGSVLWQMLILATVLNLAGVLVNGTVIVMAATLSSRLKRGSTRWPRYLLSGVFTVLAGKLLLTPR
ncbi:Threonine/homoserine/homoserine lactone efflux protein [Vogesella sp. LIG4]|nr:Threonine/homoserine/homoserine lactone efflux protein [Vogesella sp. LIG4]